MCQNEIDRKFTPKKIQSEKLVDSLVRLEMFKKASRVADCASVVEYHQYDGVEKPVLSNVWFCKNRLCPLCSWRRSMKLYGQLSKIMDNLSGNFRFIFVTLTIKNCKAEDLASTVKLLNQSFNRLKTYKYMQFVKGFFKALEITHDNYEYISKKMWYGDKKKHIKARGRYYSRLGLKIGDRNPNFDMYHPHLHIIFAVDEEYFSSPYLTQDRLCQLWQKALKVDYKPVCDIRTVKPQKDKAGDGIGYKAAVCEVGKYSVKDTDYLTGSYKQIDKTVSTLLDALHHVRLCSFGGVFEDVRKMLGILEDDPIDGDLLHINDDTIREDVSYMIIRYKWAVGFYERTITEHINIDIEVDDDE